MEFFALCDGQLTFGDAVAEINFQRDNRHPLLLGLDEQAVDFAPVEQQLALPERVVISRSAGKVLRNVEIHEPRFPAPYFGVGVAKRSLAFPEGFHLCADENKACFEFIEQFVVVGGRAVLGDDLDALKVPFFRRRFHEQV